LKSLIARDAKKMHITPRAL